MLQIIKLSNLKAQEQETDRMVLGSDAHWFAFRKDDLGQWWRLDRLLPNPVPESPSQFGAANIYVGKQEQSNLIGGFYLNPWRTFWPSGYFYLSGDVSAFLNGKSHHDSKSF